MKFKVGDRVKVRKDLKNNAFYGGNRVNEEMFMHRGQILTIRAIDGKNYLMEEDKWYWNDEMFENKDYTYEDLKKSPIGTKITFENGTVLVKDEEDYFENVSKSRDIANLYNLKDNYSSLGKIIKIEEPEYKTVYEAKEEILDEAEKRYLRGVIRPFRDAIKSIRKTNNYMNGKKNEYLTITFYDEPNMDFRNFEPNTMYKGMKIYKEYTLEELGL